jgi:cob(I)alamin adenosyltransferase
MLALTGKGDDGTTGLLGGSRVPKDDPRIEAFGTVDEASSAIGLAKGLTVDDHVRELCEELQRGLYKLGAELATEPADAGKFGAVEHADVSRLEAIAGDLEAEVPMPTGFILPGATPASGALDLARAVVRRAERRCLGLPGVPPEAMAYLNRMSLLLFILGRYEEHHAGAETRPAKA